MNLRDDKLTLTGENDKLKEKIKELEEQLNKLTVNETAKKIEAAKAKSPLVNNAFGEWLCKLF
jgi:cell division septum initiation protein DivIVA